MVILRRAGAICSHLCCDKNGIYFTESCTITTCVCGDQNLVILGRAGDISSHVCAI